MIPTARMGRGPSDSPTSPEGVGRLFFTARIERPPLYRGGSASKKNGLPAPSHHSEAARCASKEDHQAPSLSIYSVDRTPSLPDRSSPTRADDRAQSLSLPRPPCL